MRRAGLFEKNESFALHPSVLSPLCTCLEDALVDGGGGQVDGVVGHASGLDAARHAGGEEVVGVAVKGLEKIHFRGY